MLSAATARVDDSALETLRQVWTARVAAIDWTPQSIDSGAAFHLGYYLHSQVQELRWRETVEAEIPRIRAVLVLDGVDELDARRRAPTIAWEAVRNAIELRDQGESKREYGDFLSRQGAEQPKRQEQAPGRHKATSEHISEIAVRVLEAGSAPPGTMRTPFSDLNYLLNGGFWPGELVILGARPAVGKSALSSQFALAIAYDGGRTLYVSREMSTLSLGRRILAQDGHLDAAALRTGGEGVDWAGVSRSAANVHDLPMWLNSKLVTVDDVAREIQALGQVRFVVVDYLQLMHAPSHIRDQRHQVEFVSKALKALALKLNIPVLALSSLSRPAAGTDRKPTLSSLRESGALEHDADTVILLHRENDNAETECIVAKNRDGRVGTVHLEFKSDWVGFKQADRFAPEGD